MELHDALQELHVVATAPELYPIIIDLNSVSSLIGLLVSMLFSAGTLSYHHRSQFSVIFNWTAGE